MLYDEFVTTLEDINPPKITENLLSLWFDAKGNWDKAHEIVQDDNSSDAAWIHAYLHRKEGDDWNAGYWYRKAGKDHCRSTLEKEWEDLVKYFLAL